ncbi:hypothetical protein [Paractinoplanes globisporus]|uniref:PE domain-containing protein n=1 Tax=Paractinoplanes globisporus TaxID=113565 RepID=A0ABW6WMN4_9ACTN|nr:hypothetical protein [Actinoplanes globisporus]
MADHDIVAAGAAMREQARGWDDLADAMTRARARVADLALHAGAFTVVDPAAAPAARGLAEAYATSSDGLVGLLRQAGEEFDRMARSLRAAAEEYDEGDRAVADRMRGVW